jgi:hypothetical protein
MIILSGVIAGVVACGTARMPQPADDAIQTLMNDTSVATVASEGMSLVSQILGPGDSGIAVVMRNSGGMAVARASLAELLIPSAYAAIGTGGCSDLDPTVTVDVTCDDVTHDATVVRNFGLGCSVGGDETMTGQDAIAWSGMGADACSIGNVRPHFWNAVQGEGAQRLVSTDPNAPNAPTTAVKRALSNLQWEDVISRATATYTGFADDGATQSVNESVEIPAAEIVRYRPSDQAERYVLSVTTVAGSPLTILLERTGTEAPVRTIQSGTLSVVHQTAGFTATHTFQGVTWNYNICDCLPIAGTINMDITETASGANLGNRIVQFTYANSNQCGSANITAIGTGVNFPTMLACY